MPQTVEEIKKEKNDVEFLETAMEFYSEDLDTARNIKNEDQKEAFQAATNANEGVITNEKFTINDWVNKDEDDNRIC